MCRVRGIYLSSQPKIEDAKPTTQEPQQITERSTGNKQEIEKQKKSKAASKSAKVQKKTN